MPQGDTSASGKRLANDLRRIREARGVSIEALYEETKIPLGLIEAFEETALFDHPQFNRVYLRSFVRTYAQVAGISGDLSLESLEEALEGRYRGKLAVEYLGERPPQEEVTEGEGAQPAAPVEKPAEKPAEKQAEKPSEKPAEKQAEKPAEAPQAEEDKQKKKTRKQKEKPPAAVKKEQKEKKAAQEKSEEAAERPSTYVSTTTVTAESAEQDWTGQSPPPSTRRTPGAVQRADSRRMWVLGAVAVVVLALVGWLVVSMVDTTEETTGPEQVAETAAVDTSREAETATPPPRALPALGDTMTFYIIAARDKVDPIRVTVDNDLRRPYWLDQGDSMAFQARQRIIVEEQEQLDDIRLTVEGIDYPTQRRDRMGRLVVTRDSAQAFFRSLQE